MSIFYIEGVTKNEARNGKQYLLLSLKGEEQRAKVFCWDAPLLQDFSTGFSKYVVEVPNHWLGKFIELYYDPDEKYPTVNYSTVEEGCMDQESLPDDSPMKRMVLVGKYTKEDVVAKIKQLATDLCSPSWAKVICELIPWTSVYVKDEAIAGRTVHHSMKRGLYLHLYEMLEIYEAIAKLEVFSEHRHEFVIMGIAFHDWGKQTEYDLETSEMTEDAFLKGHIYMGARYLENLLHTARKNSAQRGETPAFPVTDISRAVHCVLAHHRNKDMGSPVVPATKEAMTLHFIDELSGKMNMFKNSMHMEKNYFLETTVVI